MYGPVVIQTDAAAQQAEAVASAGQTLAATDFSNVSEPDVRLDTADAIMEALQAYNDMMLTFNDLLQKDVSNIFSIIIDFGEMDQSMADQYRSSYVIE